MSENAFQTLGAPGFVIYGGFIEEPEHDPRLRGDLKYRTYSNILANTSIVAAGVRLFLNLIVKPAWRVEPKTEDAEAVRIAELVEDILNDMTTPWARVVRRAAMFKFYGFSIQEWTAKRREDGVVGFLDIEPRPQKTIHRWETDPTGTVTGMWQLVPQTGREVFLPRSKVFYAVDDSLDDSPEGLGLFRHVASRAHKLDRYELLEAWGFERDLRGTPIGRGPLAEIRREVKAGRLTEEDAARLKAPIETFIQRAMKGEDTALFLDSAPYRDVGEKQTPSSIPQWSIELLRGATTSQAEMSAAINRLNYEIARILGAEHLLLGATSAGSFALSKEKVQTFRLMVDSALGELVKNAEADLVVPLFQLNGWSWDYFPGLKVDQVQHSDIEQVTTALADLSRAGAPLMPDDPAVNEVRDLLGLSHAPEIRLDLGAPLPEETGADEGEGEPEDLDEPEDRGEGE